MFSEKHKIISMHGRNTLIVLKYGDLAFAIYFTHWVNYHQNSSFQNFTCRIAMKQWDLIS
jgi:hypothetical protein